MEFFQVKTVPQRSLHLSFQIQKVQVPYVVFQIVCRVFYDILEDLRGYLFAGYAELLKVLFYRVNGPSPALCIRPSTSSSRIPPISVTC